MYSTEMLCYKQQIEFYSSSSYQAGAGELNGAGLRKKTNNFRRRAFKANKKVNEKLFFGSSAGKSFSLKNYLPTQKVFDCEKMLEICFAS